VFYLLILDLVSYLTFICFTFLFFNIFIVTYYCLILVCYCDINFLLMDNHVSNHQSLPVWDL